MSKTSAEKKRDYHFRLGDISPIPKARNAKRRSRCRRNLSSFLRTYFPHLYYRPFSADQKRIIKTLQQSILEVGKSAEALPRGSGKTTIGEGAIIWATLYGHRCFPVVVGPHEEHAKSIINDLKAEFETNDRLLSDFPEVCYPIRELEGRHARARSQHVDGKLTNIKWTGTEIIFPTIEGSKVSGTIIKAVGITSSIRGMKHGVRRPDFVLLDDPQTRESAASVSQTKRREEIILGDILGLAGHNKAISAYMTCTVIFKDDLADTFLDNDLHPEWIGKRAKLVYAWPEDNPLWDEYDELWRGDQIQGDSTFKNATAFYKGNRKLMDQGIKVADKHLFDKSVELSAIQHARNLKLSSPDAFEAEYQNEPVSRQFLIYELDPKLVQSRVNNMPRLALDPEIRLVVAFCDINFIGLHWSLVGFRNDRTGFVLDYGRIPERGELIHRNANRAEIKRRLYDGLAVYAEKMNNLNLSVPIRAAGIDRGFEPQTVHNFCRYAKTRFAMMPAWGYASNKYQPGKNIVGKPGVECHLTQTQYGQYLAMNACYFQEMMQRGFLSRPGQSGSLSFYGRDGSRHSDIADHVCAKVLADKAEGKDRIFYKWDMKVGADDHWGDALKSCFALATWFLGDEVIESTVGGRGKTKKKRKRKQKRRKPKILIED